MSYQENKTSGSQKDQETVVCLVNNIGNVDADGEFTRQARKHLMEDTQRQSIDEDLEYDEDDIPSRFDENEEYFTSFSQKLREALQARGALDDISGQKKYLLKLLHEKAQDPEDDCDSKSFKACIDNWLKGPQSKGTRPSGNARERVFRICFALGFDDKETENFFRKAYWELPFNYRETSECIYWYCLHYGLTYQDAMRIKRKVEERTAPLSNSKSSEENTIAIRNWVRSCQTEEELIDGLSKNQSSLKEERISVRKKLQKLLDECRKRANEIRTAGLEPCVSADNKDMECVGLIKVDKKNGKGREFAPKEIESDEDLLEAIYGFRFREGRDNEQVYKGYKFWFQKYIGDNFPEVTQVQAICNSEKPMSHDAIRKSLILFGFYSFYAAARLESGSDMLGDYFKQFQDDIGSLLVECGYGPLYVRNPYDWMFLHCASVRDRSPLEELRAFAMNFYQPNKNCSLESF